ncbi:Asp23/Gls24 family envelope stress response protein [Dactylosporangium sp. NPDC050688]|uniref:Asp23/Gls24 family envelope stress response protein n=1 Tax=Dactylosporangium sp. NPDC050688 TaxID=3157217 RepID=UPI0034106D6F
MTEVTAGIPAQRTDVDDPDMTGDALSIEPAAPGSAAGTTAERVSAFADAAADRVGELATTTATASGRIASQVVDRLRNNAELAAERGTTTIADEVVEKIAGIAAREVPGVYDLGGDVARVFASVRDRIGLGDGDERESGNRGVHVRLEGRSAAVRVTLVIEYGFVLYSVAEKVRANVIGAVENLLGLEVTSVDIVVDDVHVSDTLPESAAASAA